MHRMMTPAVCAAAALLLALPAQAQKDELVIGIGQFPTGFHPNLTSHVAASYVVAMAHRPFTTYDPDWNQICILCTELPDVANGTARDWTTPDGEPGRAVDYAIQANAVWGDGTPVTTDDVQFVWDVGHVPEAGANNQEMYRRMEKLEIHDDKRFTIYTNKRECDYKGLGDFKLVPAHLDRDHFAEPAEYKNRTLYETDTTNPGLYMGPYVISRVEPGATIVLEQNPNWWGEQKPHFKRIVVRTIENTAAMAANLLSGEIDYIAGEDGLSLDQALNFESDHGDTYDVVYKPSLLYEHVDLMLDNPMLADRQVRRALLHAVNRVAISEQLFEGKQPVAHGNVNPLDTVYDPDAPKYPHDPALAGAMLDEAGWSEIRDGVRHNAAGERLSFELMTTAGNRTRELVEQVIQSDLKQVGVDVRLRNEPARVLFGQTIRERRFTSMAMFAWFSSPENVPYTTLHSKMIPTEENNWSGQNYTGYSNPEMDDALDRILVECGDETQDQLWRKIQALYAEDLPALPLYFRATPFVFPKWLTGVRPTGHQFPSTLWVEQWAAR